MRVLCVIDSLVPGGAERSLAAVAPHLVDLGVTLDVATLWDRPGLNRDLESAGANVVCLAGAGGRPGWLLRTAQLIRRVHPQVVHTTLFEADIAGRLGAATAGVPSVSSLVSETYGPAHLAEPGVSRWRARGAQFLDASTARLAYRLHAVSEHVADTMSERLRFPRSRIEVIPRGRDPKLLGRRTAARRAAARAGLGIADTDKLIFAAARQQHPKGLDLLLDAFPTVLAHVPEARVVVAGREGAATPGLQATMCDRALAQRVSFLGERADVADLLCGADAFVLPSRREGFPGALLEAMALEVPIVASDLPQVREVAGGGGAMLARAAEPSDLAAAIVATLRDDVESKTRVVNARHRFESQFTIERVAEQMLGFYERAIRRSG